jgi:adenylate cyclase
MTTQTTEVLQQQLELKQKAIDLMLAIDYIRDTMPEPSSMMTSLVSVLVEHLNTELCVICLADRETQELKLKAICDKDHKFGHLSPEVLQELDRQTLNKQDVLLWEGDAIPRSLRTQTPSEALVVVAIPIFLKGERLGVMLFARTDMSFTPDDINLIKIAESQVDSAVIQAYEYYTLQQRNRELETIYHVDSIRDQHLPFDEMLNAVLREVRHVIQAEAGFIMLYNQAEKFLELRASTNDDLFPITPHYDFINRVANESLQQAGMVWYNDRESKLHSIMCLPLILNGEIIGVLGVVNRYGRHSFDSEDRRLLSAIASQMDTAIFESIEQRRLRQILGRSVDPRVMERLLASPETNILNRERSVLSVLYADIRGSTALAERTEPDLLVGFINDYLGHMADIILAYEGTLDKFVGDEVMALFGAPLPQPDHALRAIRTALEMQAAHQEVMKTWEAQGVEASPIGIGIATGELLVGEFGCQKRTDYTVIGRAANLGSRICGVAKGGQVLISQETCDLVKEAVETNPISGLHLKGVAHDVTVYEVLRILA